MRKVFKQRKLADYIKTNTDKETLSEYRKLISRKKQFHRKINTLQYQIKNITYTTRNSIMNKAPQEVKE